MTHWHRDPKRLKLLEHLVRTDAEFVLNSDDFSEEEFLRLRSTLCGTIFAEKLRRGSLGVNGYREVLIVASSKELDLPLISPERWAGILVTPRDSLRKERILTDLFLRNPLFPNGIRAVRVVARGTLRAFILDARMTPPLLFAIKANGTDRSPANG
jgi:hypothetical protein